MSSNDAGAPSTPEVEGAPSHRGAESSRRLRLHVVGDSISLHYGPYLRALLENEPCPRFTYSRKGEVGPGDGGRIHAPRDLDAPLPDSANGGDSEMVLAYLEARLGALPADLLLVNCGLHDIKTDPGSGLRQVELERYRENLDRIVRLVRGSGRALAWVATTPVVDEAHRRWFPGFHRHAADQLRYGAAALAVMAAHGVPVVDLDGFTLRLGGVDLAALFCDHVHFHEPVRAQQAAFIAGWLQGRYAGAGSR